MHGLMSFRERAKGFFRKHQSTTEEVAKACEPKEVACDEPTVAAETSESICSVKRLIRDNWNSYAGIAAQKAFFAFKADVLFPGAKMLADEFFDETDGLVKAFPDFELSIADEDITETKPGVVVVEKAVAQGTHTGSPYGFGPYPPIAATGIRCKNDPERLEFHFDEEGKITKMVVTPSGMKTGPQGFYESIGGIAL